MDELLVECRAKPIIYLSLRFTTTFLKRLNRMIQRIKQFLSPLGSSLMSLVTMTTHLQSAFCFASFYSWIRDPVYILDS